MLLNSEMRPREKSLALAYLMLIGGHLGVHRFYLRRIATAIVQLILFFIAAIGYVILIVGSDMDASDTVAIVGLIVMLIGGLPLLIWIIVDLFMIPRMVRQLNGQAEQDILQQLEWLRQNPPAPRQTSNSAPAQQPPYQPLDLNKR